MALHFLIQPLVAIFQLVVIVGFVSWQMRRNKKEFSVLRVLEIAFFVLLLGSLPFVAAYWWLAPGDADKHSPYLLAAVFVPIGVLAIWGILYGKRGPLCSVRAVRLTTRMETPPIISQVPKRPSRFPLWWVLVINLLEVLLTVQFYWVPYGTRIRPMGLAYYVFMLAVAGLAAIPMILPTLRQHPRLIWPWIVLALALTPYPIAEGMYSHAEKVCGFISEP